MVVVEVVEIVMVEVEVLVEEGSEGGGGCRKMRWMHRRQ